MNNQACKYSQLSSLQEIREEKKRLKKLIKKQEQTIENDWDEIYRFWSFVPKLGRTIKNAIQAYPLGMTLFNLLLNLISPKKKKE